MSWSPLRSSSLLDAFSQVTDPRDRRGIRHPFAGILTLVFLGLLGRMTEFAVIRRWARRHWTLLQAAAGLHSSRTPLRHHAGTYFGPFLVGRVSDGLWPLVAARAGRSRGLGGSGRRQDLQARQAARRQSGANAQRVCATMCKCAWASGPWRATKARSRQCSKHIWPSCSPPIRRSGC